MKGKGFSITLWKCKEGLSKDIGFIKGLIDEVISVIGMKAISGFHKAVGKEDMPGFSIMKIIETSHVACHSFIINNAFMFSVESCKDFDEAVLKDLLIRRFRPKGHNFVVYPVLMPVKVTR